MIYLDGLDNSDSSIKLRLHTDVVATSTFGNFSEAVTKNQAFDGNTPLILPQQTHSTNVALVNNPSDEYPDTDALITSMRGIAIGIRTADCVPILLYASDIHHIAAIHAGWKGSLNGIIDNTLSILFEKGASPHYIYACFGAAICRQCYEVDESLAQQFREKGFDDCIYYDRIDPLTNTPFDCRKPHLDLIKVNTRRMIDCGLPAKNIQTQSHCTRHFSIERDGMPDFPYHSWRRNPQTEFRNVTYITMP